MRHQGPVLLLVAFVVSPYTPKHTWPWFADTQHSTMSRRHVLELPVDNTRHDSGKRFRARTGFGSDRTRKRRHHDSARFGLPPSIHNRASSPTDFVVIPHPRFGIDPLAYRSEQTKAAEVMLFDMVITPFNEGPYRRRCSVENGCFVLLDDGQNRSSSGQLGAPSYIT